MKKIILMLLLGITFCGKSQTMEESLTKVFNQMDTAKTVNQFMMASAQFDLITNKYPNEWITNYYSAYSKAILSYYESNNSRKDLILDQAMPFFEKAKQMQPENSEIYALGALLSNARLVVDGGSRWKEFGAKFDSNLELATKLNPKNPRIYYLKGMSVFYTPKMFGGGAKNAKPHFEKAKELFVNQDTSSILNPFWGNNRNEYLLGECNKD